MSIFAANKVIIGGLLMNTVLILALAVALLAMLFLYNKVRRELQEVRKSTHIIKAFLVNFSHEIRMPLTALIRAADVLSEKNLYLSKTEKSDLGAQLRYNSGLINTLLDELMVFSDSDAIGHELKDEMFSPNVLCRRCLEANLQNAYLHKEVTLNFNRELNDEFFIKSDLHVVELILNKLILNACRFTEKGSVTMGCSITENPGTLTIFVKDTGNGIPEQRKDSLFSWFDSPDDMMDEAELDLSICQRLAMKLGGELMLDPNYFNGTRVLLLLPLK